MRMDSARNHSISAALLLALALTVPPVVAHADAPTGAAPATSGSTHTGHDSAAPTPPRRQGLLPDVHAPTRRKRATVATPTCSGSKPSPATAT
jgi:hypothetical protein